MPLVLSLILIHSLLYFGLYGFVTTWTILTLTYWLASKLA